MVVREQKKVGNRCYTTNPCAFNPVERSEKSEFSKWNILNNLFSLQTERRKCRLSFFFIWNIVKLWDVTTSIKVFARGWFVMGSLINYVTKFLTIFEPLPQTSRGFTTAATKMLDFLPPKTVAAFKDDSSWQFYTNLYSF